MARMSRLDQMIEEKQRAQDTRMRFPIMLNICKHRKGQFFDRTVDIIRDRFKTEEEAREEAKTVFSQEEHTKFDIEIWHQWPDGHMEKVCIESWVK